MEFEALALSDLASWKLNSKARSVRKTEELVDFGSLHFKSFVRLRESCPLFFSNSSQCRYLLTQYL